MSIRRRDAVVQLGQVIARAAARDVTVTTVTGFIRVLECLRKAAWCFPPPATPRWRTG